MLGLGLSWLHEQAERQRMLDHAVLPATSWDWKWHKTVRYTAVSWAEHAPPIFPTSVVSPCGRWTYENKTLPSGRTLAYYSGLRRGSVSFDADVTVSALFETRYVHHDPWMSLTPAEYVTLRPGVKLARGHTIVAGLGLGWQLSRVLERAQVERVTLVERDQSLIDWILPYVANPRNLEIEVVVGDARKVIPEMTADVALIDIFATYGGNSFTPCPRVGKVWCWGSAGA